MVGCNGMSVSRDAETVCRQAVDKARQRRSRGAQRLNVLQSVRLASSLAAALLDGLSEQPASDLIHMCVFLLRESTVPVKVVRV